MSKVDFFTFYSIILGLTLNKYMALIKKFLNLVRQKPDAPFTSSPIFDAIEQHDLEQVKALLKQNGSLIFEKNKWQENLLFSAFREHAFDIVLYLDKFNFSLATHTDRGGNNILHLACQKNSDTLIHHFMARHPDLIYQKNNHNQYPDDITTHYHLYQLLHAKRINPENSNEHFMDNMFDSTLSKFNTKSTKKALKM